MYEQLHEKNWGVSEQLGRRHAAPAYISWSATLIFVFWNVTYDTNQIFRFQFIRESLPQF